MSESIPHVEQRCVFCGNAYREPRWDRAYTCGACGQPLREAAQRARRGISLPPWLFYATGAVLLTAMLVWLVTTRRAEMLGVRRDLQPGFGLLQQLPPHQDERIRHRLALLEADRRIDAQDPVLIALQAESYLQLGVLHQRSDAKKAAEELRRCQALAQELASAAPDVRHVAVFLNQQAQTPSTLGWAVNGSSSNTTRLDMLPEDAAARLMGDVPSRLSMPEYPSKMEFGGDRARRDSRTDPDIMVPGSSFPTMGRPQTNSPGRYGGFPAPLMNTPRGFFGSTPRSFEVAPGYEGGPSLKDLRALVAAQPADPKAAEALGKRLESQAQFALAVSAGREPGRTISARNLSDAAQVYVASAARVRTRLRRAQMLFAAAGVRRKLGDTDEEIRLLRRAADEAPYAPLVWRQLQNALLNKGDFGKAREAWKQYQDWLLPRTRDRRI